MVLRDDEPAQYTYDELVKQWYDPYTGYYYDDNRQEWYMPGQPRDATGQSSGVAAAGQQQVAQQPAALNPPKPLSLRSQADHIQRQQERKRGVKRR